MKVEVKDENSGATIVLPVDQSMPAGGGTGQNDQENLQNEQENSSNQEISVQNDTSKIQPTNNRKFCHICNKEFSILENLNNHLKYGNCERNEIKFINKIFDEKTQLPTKDTESASNRDEYFS